MRLLILLLPALLCAADAAPQLTADDLQNLTAAARIALRDLTPDQIVAVAQAIKHAETDIAAMRTPKPVTVPEPHSATAAAVKP